MPLSPPKIVVPLTACTDRVRLQGQKTGSTVRIYASPNNIFDKVCDAPADGPDQTFVLTRRLVAGEHVYATQTVPGDASGSNVNPELVQPEPALSEIGPITADTHLHACARCAAFGNGYPGAEVRIISASQGPLGTAIVDPDTGAARVAFTSALHQNESLSGSQSICGKTGPVRALPAPDLPASTQRRLPAPRISADLYACERAVLVEGVSDGANVRLFRDGGEYASACFDYPREWFRLRDPLKHGERITVDQRFLTCELFSDPSPETKVGLAQDVPAPVILGRLCKGTRAIRLTGLRYGATVQIVQTNGSFVMGSTIAEAEAWDDTCDIPLTDALDPVRGTKVIAVQILCSRVSPDSNTAEIHKLSGTLPPPTVVGPLFECGRMVRVAGIYPGARIEVYMSCANPPYIRLLTAQYVYDTRAELLVSPALVAHQRVFARQIACRQVSDSAPEPVQSTGDLQAPGIEDCGSHLHVTGVVPGARVEVYVNGSFFRSGRSGGPTSSSWSRRPCRPARWSKRVSSSAIGSPASATSCRSETM